MPKSLRLIALLAITLLALVLGGCAIPRMIDSDVQSFTSAVPARTPALYRFERLPSQGNTLAQDQIETMAAQALAKVGLTPAPLVSGAVAGTAAAAPAAAYAVQIDVQVSAITSPYAPTYLGGGYSVPFGFHHSGRWGLMMDLESPWYRHAVHILLRDSVSGQNVYETSASFDGPWKDTANLLPVVLDAALSGYPVPPQGPRKVVIELPAGNPPASP